MNGVGLITGRAAMETSPVREAARSPHYGSVSLVKRMQQQLHSPGGHHVPQPANLFEPESASLMTDLSFLRGGKEYRSRDRISRFLDHSIFGALLDLLLAFLALLFVASFITTTYTAAGTLPSWLWFIELLCAGSFTVDFLFRGIYLACHRVDYLLSFAGFINLVAILPVLPTSFFNSYHTLWYDGQYWRFVYPFRFVKCYLECKAVLARCHSYMTPVRQFAILCYIQIVLIIAGAASIIQIAETSDGKHTDTHTGDWTFFNSFFNSVLVFVTIQTPPADNVLAKVFVGVLVIVLILIVPYQISKVLDLSKSFTEYELTSFKPSRNAKHVVLCGDLTPSRIDHFFHEVFHDDHDVVDINVVVLSDEEPSTAMVSLLMDPFFEKRTSFIQGSILDVDDAERAAVGTADAIFILTRRSDQEEHMTSDHRTLMRVLAAKRLAPCARIFAQMHLSSNRHLLEDLDVKNVLYFSEVMHSLLAQNCVCPGFSTLIYNLTSTSSDDSIRDDSDRWEDKYVRSASEELYSVTLPSSSVIFGKTFAEVASLVYAECKGVILLAVQSSALGSQGRIFLNPGNTYTCSGGETAFVIARNRREADEVTKLSTHSSKSSASWIEHRSSNTSLIKTNEGGGNNGSSKRKSKTVDWKTTTECSVEPIEFEDENDGQSDDDDIKHDRHKQTRASGFSHNLFKKSSRASSIEDVVIEDLGYLFLSLQHIAVCVVSANSFPHHLEYLIGPLRVKALHRHRPIVIVTSVLPTDDQFETFRHFKHIYFVKGSPFQQRTLRRACIDSAHKIVIMGDEGNISESSSSELLADASCIALHKTIVSLIGPTRAPRIITELVNRANVHFITQNLIPSEWFPNLSAELTMDTSTSEYDDEDPEPMLTSSSPHNRYSIATATSSASFSRDFFMSPAFASGLTYSTSLCDSLMVNQYFNPMIKNIMREFIFASWKDNDYMTTPVTPPSGCDPTNAMSPSPASSSAFSPSETVHRSSLFAVEIPLDFVGKTFEYVFHYLLSSDNILVVGVYRCRPDRMLYDGKARIQLSEADRSVPFGYVYVSPLPQEVLTGNDLLYVLSRKQPRWA